MEFKKSPLFSPTQSRSPAFWALKGACIYKGLAFTSHLPSSLWYVTSLREGGFSANLTFRARGGLGLMCTFGLEEEIIVL